MESNQLRRPAYLAVLLVIGLLSPAWAEGSLTGLTLEQALRELQSRGLEVIFTTRMVRPEMRVLREPEATTPRGILDEILAPHGLEAREIVPSGGSKGGRDIVPSGGRDRVGGRIVVVAVPRDTGPGETEGVEPIPDARDGPSLTTVPVTRDEIDVRSHPPWILGDALSTLELERDEMMALPHLGDDAFRGLTLLPGTTGNDVSAAFSLRGSRQDEVMVRLDGLEIFEPYHLKDFNDTFSIVPPATLGGLTLRNGGFSVEHGGRMSGILDLVTLDPSWRRRTELGLTPLSARANGSGTFHGARARWLASLRGGSLEIPFRLIDEKENPRFWDVYGKVEELLSPSHSLRGSVLSSEDKLDFAELEERDGGDVLEDFRTRYGSSYLWADHQGILTADLFAVTRASFSDVDRDRGGTEASGEHDLAVSDLRAFNVAQMSQDWNLLLGTRHALKWGFDVRFLAAEYDYTSEWAFFDDALAGIRHQGRSGTLRFQESFRGQQYGFYFADHIELGRWTIEPGVRFDRNTVIDDDERVSPRLSLSYALGEQNRLRLAWGHYYQSQRLYELQVEDGVTSFAEPELAEHRILGFEHVFGRGEGRRPLTLRAELYQRRVRDPRARFENLYDPISIVAELEADRVRVAPTSSLAQGIEVLLGGSVPLRGSAFEGGRHRVDWFLSYSYATIEDRLDGRDVPRAIDQPHTVVADLGYHSSWGWSFNLAGRYHTGWPSTAISGRPDGDEIVPVLGPLYGERLPDYHRVDLRASRGFQLPRGRLELVFEVQNLTNSANVRGFDVDFESEPGGAVRVMTRSRSWGRLLPSVDVSWKF